MKIKRCDNCGKTNPPIFDNNPRLCASCATPGGYYRSIDCTEPGTMGANGKINWRRLQFPFRISWRGWWTL